MEAPAGWRRQGNLPAELTSFVGRAPVLSSLTRLIREHRMVTVTGIGGVGKTRVALRAAASMGEEFPDGVWLVNLSRLQDPALVAHAMIEELGLVDSSPRTEAEFLVESLAGKRMLLVLDTCEHLVAACASIVDRLLRSAPGVSVLATSRQHLNVPGEHAFVVSPWDVPPPGAPLEELIGSDPLRLFAERAASVSPGFTVDASNAETVADICRRVDGIPLAIELAAVRLRVLSVEQIRTLLGDRFAVLSGGSRTSLPRHQTLRGAVGWSHEQCEPTERLLWARLAVFAGDFDLEAAAQVCCDHQVPPGELLDLLTGLVEKSVLLSEERAGERRYRLLDTLRDYGAEWLGQLGETDAMHRRHRDHYMRLAKQAEEAWSGPDQIIWFARMRREHANLRASLDFSLNTPGEEKHALDMLAALWFLWMACGLPKEGRHYLDRALNACRQPSPERCKALWVSSYLASAQGDFEAAIDAADECTADGVQIGDASAVVFATKMRGTVAFLQNDLPRASAYLGAAIEFHGTSPGTERKLNPGLLPAIVELALVLTARDEPQEAVPLLRDCLSLCEDRGELWLRSYARYALALAQRALGDVEGAAHNARESLRIKRRFHDVVGSVLGIEALAWLSLEEGDADRASRLLGAAQANWQTFGLPLFGSPFFTQEHGTVENKCRDSLGDQGYEHAFSEGSKLALDDAITYATGEPQPAG
ncbi:ATP-binding protein [Bailinhaonella thermotolerans]|uniref:ATPase n=1 Tax=Bailinhaonella thermotolerans TaxID=1070861 RepID=A0A3A4BSL2_9ACTN|nr:NB-ARC domain-containing protein [Bailinhaonella thermotolerans]RJL34306.1 ATPase [Bailinhaonella thermotolerans]